MGNLSLRQRKPIKVLVLGLYYSGKSSLLFQANLGEVVTSIPTIGINVETVSHKNIILQAWDVGGRSKIRPLLRHYYQNTEAVIFVVDSSDEERLPEAERELLSLVSESELEGVPVAVALNKWDLSRHMSRERMHQALGLAELRKSRPCESFSTSSVTDSKSDFFDMLEWLNDNTRRTEENRRSNIVTGQSSVPVLQRVVFKLKSLLLT